MATQDQRSLWPCTPGAGVATVLPRRSPGKAVAGTFTEPSWSGSGDFIFHNNSQWTFPPWPSPTAARMQMLLFIDPSLVGSHAAGVRALLFFSTKHMTSLLFTTISFYSLSSHLYFSKGGEAAPKPSLPQDYSTEEKLRGFILTLILNNSLSGINTAVCASTEIHLY